MSESFVQVTEGTGKKLRTFQRTRSGNTVYDEFVLLAERHLPSFTAQPWDVSTAAAASHLLELNGSSTKRLYVRRIVVQQSVLAGASAHMRLNILRLSTAGTGGTSLSISAHDPADSVTATAQRLPSTPGTSIGIINTDEIQMSSVSINGSDNRWVWEQNPNGKPIVIPVGIANGIAVHNTDAVASGAVGVHIEWDEELPDA